MKKLPKFNSFKHNVEKIDKHPLTISRQQYCKMSKVCFFDIMYERINIKFNLDSEQRNYKKLELKGDFNLIFTTGNKALEIKQCT